MKPPAEIRYDALLDVMLCINEALRYGRRILELQAFQERDRELVGQLERLVESLREDLRIQVRALHDGGAER